MMPALPVFAFFSSPVPGHILPMSAIAKQLLARGERVVYFTLPDAAPFIEKKSIPVQQFGEKEFPKGSWEKAWHNVGASIGPVAALQTIFIHRRIAIASCRELPALFKQHGITHLVLDQNQFQGHSLAEFCGLPFIHVTCTVPMNHDHQFNIAPVSECWPLAAGPFKHFKRLRNRLGFLFIDLCMLPVTLAAVPLIRKNGLRLRWRLADTFSTTLTLVGLTPTLNWSLTSEALTYVGSLIDPDSVLSTAPPLAAPTFTPPPSALPSAALPSATLPEHSKPLIYVSLGTISTGMQWIYDEIIAALEALDVEFIVSRGKWLSESGPSTTHKNGVSVEFAPQLQILKRCALFINHAGINSVVEALSLGVPLLLLPITNDQPGMSARAVAAGVAMSLSQKNWERRQIKAAISSILSEPAFRIRATSFQQEIAELGGSSRAAELIIQWSVKK